MRISIAEAQLLVPNWFSISPSLCRPSCQFLDLSALQIIDSKMKETTAEDDLHPFKGFGKASVRMLGGIHAH
jgi:hypothetical protein